MNKRLKNLINLVTDKEISDDLWGDVMSQNASEIVFDLLREENLDTLKIEIEKLNSEKSRFRLIQAILESGSPLDFNYFVNLIKDSEKEIAEIVFDNLRLWDLDKNQKSILLERIKSVKNKTKLLDIPILRLQESLSI